ncbi:bifunctional diguanylate cyclase/phosphodiesterase [Blastochloris tepida]|uniref:Bifunctional diguanylate cyclase/phosphodiesterase n=1 Tax=Blastochloris tepida TaxID=2233851 RepID=A0A348G338_9HYPH|nr:EAL domain-containing protein [Blastochloris tepida]BBF93971.1 hypothetical protein BLTE_26560 [Blastochloris tepida]
MPDDLGLRSGVFRTRRFAYAGAAILLLSIIAIGVSVWRMRADELSSQIDSANRLAIVLGGHVEKSIQAVDLALRSLQEQIGQQGLTGTQDLRQLVETRWSPQALRDFRERLPQATTISIADANGNVLGSTDPRSKGISIADRSYFQEIMARADDALVTSLPLAGKVTGVPAMAFARRLTAPDGAFLGIVLAAVEVDYFRRVFSALESIEDIRVLFLKRDGTMLLHYPDPIDRAGMKVPATSPWYGIVEAGSGSFRAQGIFEPGRRWVVVHVLRDYPFVLNVAITEDVALARWHDSAVITCAGGGILLLCASFFLFACLMQIRRLERSDARLRENGLKLQQSAAELAVSNARFDAALGNIVQGLCMIGQDYRITVANDRFAELYGLTPDEVTAGTPLKRLEDACAARGTLVNAWSQHQLRLTAATVTGVHQLEDGRVISVRLQPMDGGGWMTTHEDITARHRSELQVAHMARHDLLTDLCNRATFAEKIEEAGARLRRWGTTFAVLLLDLDHFKQVNDTLGHPAGDALLCEVARRLNACLRETDALARLGGDEFAILLSDTSDQRGAAIGFSNRILEQLGAPCRIEGQELVISASIGIALAPEHGLDPNELIKNADLALDRAKADGRNGFAIFDAGMLVQATARQQIDAELRRAIAEDELVLYFQPQIAAQTRRMSGAEALLRWHHPGRGIIPPSEFIPIAEETGLIIPIGERVLRCACAAATGWPADTKVAVNLSPVQFRSGALFDTIVRALSESGLPPHRLEVEITESVLLESAASNLDLIKRLRELGISVALDDFGTGYASLSYLMKFPFDTLKIDKYFTMNLMKRKDCEAIVASVIALAGGIGITTVAEGVETEEHFAFLKSAGIDYCQGYLFGRPMPPSELRFDPAARASAKRAAA